MDQLLRWQTLRVSRSRFLTKAATGTFGLFAGLAVGVPRALATDCCDAPSGSCGGVLCTSFACHSHTPDVTCQGIDFLCGGGNCWSSSCGGTCCDCQCCQTSGPCWYCYCYG